MEESTYTYKCRPGYGSKEMLIEIDGAEDEFFLQFFLNIISEMNPQNQPDLDEMHTMLEMGDVERDLMTDLGPLNFHQDVYGTAFVSAEGHPAVIDKIDSILKIHPSFSRTEINPKEYE
jgi:hypothetical protein